MTSKPSAVELSRSALERLVLVGDDLAYLTNLPSDRLFSHTEVRLCAGILRRLLVDGQLIASWRSLGNEPSSLIVETSEIDTALSKWPAQWIKSAWAGGPGGGSQAQHAGLIIGSIPQAEYEQLDSMDSAFSAASLPTTGNRITMPLQTWLKSTAAAINTENMGLIRIKRESVLKYWANRKGGVHFDPRIDFNSRVPRKQRQSAEYYLLDRGFIRVGHLSGPEFEVASMARIVATTPWARALIMLAEENAPADFRGDPYEMQIWMPDRQPDGTNWATFRFGGRD